MTQRIIDFSYQRTEAINKLNKEERNQPDRDASCVFCDVIYGESACFKVYEDDDCMAILDVLPIIDGHTLLIPKAHYPRISQMPDDLSAALGRVMPKLSRAIMAATGQDDFNLIQNNGHAQAVHHVHFHIVPAPSAKQGWKPSSRTGYPDNRLGDLDDEDGDKMVLAIRKELEQEATTKNAKM